MRRFLVANVKRGFVWLLALFLVTSTLGLAWAATPYQPRPGSVADATEGVSVTVEERQSSYVISDAGTRPADTALVFYPGGRVDPEAYVPVFTEFVAETGMRVYVPKMPLTLAWFDQGRATTYRTRAPEIQEWYVGGHSLGGAAACRYVSNNPDQVDGVVLFASYCDRSINGTGLPALQLLGSRDGVISSANVTGTTANLPVNTTFFTIPGANHSQFGSYAGQPDDNSAEISYDVAHDQIGTVLHAWIAIQTERVAQPTGNTTLGGQNANSEASR
jgi:dienelactone hydrolase